MARDKILKVRLTEAEYQQLKEFAEEHGTNMSDMVRWVIRTIPALRKSELEKSQELPS
jgi:16S rRNA U516 pseudouridylate synthase RsuA-like enzyme